MSIAPKIRCNPQTAPSGVWQVMRNRGSRDATRDRYGNLPDLAEVAFFQDERLRAAGRDDMTQSGLQGFACILAKDDEGVVEATVNAMAVARVIKPRCSARSYRRSAAEEGDLGFGARIKTATIGEGVLVSLRTADVLPEI